MKNTETVNIIIADDHPLFRSGVRSELEKVSFFNVIAETGDGKEALQLIMDLNPDIAILDFQMPGFTGLEIMQKLEDLLSKPNVIMLTMHRDKKIFFKALESGASGYVLKDEAVVDIIKAVKAVNSGEHFISDSLKELLLEKAVGKKNSRTENLVDDLTTAERRILSLVAELKSNQEICEELFISKRTVENHKVKIANKLELQSARGLLKFALQHKDYLI